MVVHFEHAFVALATMMCSIWLSPKTSLTHSHATTLFLFISYRFNNRFGLKKNMLFVFVLVKGAGFGFDVAVVEMHGLSWLTTILYHLLILKIFLLILSRLLNILYQ